MSQPGMRDNGSAIEMVVPHDVPADTGVWLRDRLREMGYEVDKRDEIEDTTVFLVYPDEDDVVKACPECNHAGQLYERESGEWRCYDCQAEFDQPNLRRSRRGENLTLEDRRRGAKNGPTPSSERMAEIARGNRNASSEVAD